MHLIPSWDSFVDTPELKTMLDKVIKKEITMTDVLIIFSAGHRYGELNNKRDKH